MTNAELERLLREFRVVPPRPQHDYDRAQSYADIIQAEFSSARRKSTLT